MTTTMSITRSGKLDLLTTNGRIYIYMVTIKSNNDRYISKKTLDGILSLLQTKLKGEWSTPVYELDSLFRMHIHVLCSLRRQPYFPNLYKKIKLHLHFKKVYCLAGIVSYMCKHHGQDPEVIHENEVTSYCHFHRLYPKSENAIPAPKEKGIKWKR